MTPDKLNSYLNAGDFLWELDGNQLVSKKGLSEEDAQRYTQILNSRLGLNARFEDYGATTYRIAVRIPETNASLPEFPGPIWREVMSFLDSSDRTELAKDEGMRVNLSILEDVENRTLVEDIVSSLDPKKYSDEIKQIRDILSHPKFLNTSRDERKYYIQKEICHILKLKRFLRREEFEDFEKNKDIWKIVFETVHPAIWKGIFRNQPEFRTDRELLKEAVIKGGITVLPEELWDDLEFNRVVGELGGRSLDSIPAALRNDREVLKNYLSQLGVGLSAGTEAEKDDEELVKIAVRSMWTSIVYASDRLKQDPNILKIAIGKYLANSFINFPTDQDEELKNHLRTRLPKELHPISEALIEDPNFIQGIREEMHKILIEDSKSRARNRELSRGVFGFGVPDWVNLPNGYY